jgi:hypothetical protein
MSKINPRLGAELSLDSRCQPTFIASPRTMRPMGVSAGKAIQNIESFQSTEI